jgi:adenine/guanine phosphoribosyltransferase-like PRPP-binding protein
VTAATGIILATATTEFWQTLLAAWPADIPVAGPFTDGYPVLLPDGRVLVLPIRPLPDGAHAVASLLVNHAAFQVVDALTGAMTDLARADAPDIVIGLPTLGLTLAPAVAHGLGHARYVPLGYSRKFWYRDELSEPVASITSPGGSKRLYLDPNLAPLIAGRRVAVVDDAISSGTSIVAVMRLLQRVDVEVASVVVAMKQTTRWQQALAAYDPQLPARVKGVFGCPMFARGADGWMPIAGSGPHIP